MEQLQGCLLTQQCQHCYNEGELLQPQLTVMQHMHTARTPDDLLKADRTIPCPWQEFRSAWSGMVLQ